MHVGHNLHLLNFRKKYRQGLEALKANFMIFQFAANLVGSFDVLFIYHFGNSLFSGIVLAATYFFSQRFVVLFMIPIVARLMTKYGYRKVMFTALIVLVCRLILLSVTTAESLYLLVPALILGGFVIPGYYLGFHGIFLEDNDDVKIGQQYGALDMSGKFAAIAAPLLGGIIIDRLGFSSLYNIAYVLIVLSATPLFLMDHHKKHVQSFSLIKVIRFILSRPRIMKAFFWWHFTAGIQGLFWSIYLFLIVVSYTKFGLIGTVVTLINGITVYIAGKIYDKKTGKRMFLISSLAVAVTWIFRFLSQTFVGVLISDFANRMFSPPWWMKIRRTQLKAGEEEDSLVFAASHEYLVSIGSMLAWSVGVVAFWLSGGNWLIFIPLTVIPTLYIGYLVKDY